MKKRKLYLYECYSTFVLARNKQHAMNLLFRHEWGESLKRVKRKNLYFIKDVDEGTKLKLPVKEAGNALFNGKPGVVDIPDA